MLKCIYPTKKTFINGQAIYAAIYKGLLCFFNGEAPNFGASGDDSGHKSIFWCPSIINRCNNENNVNHSNKQKIEEILEINDNNIEQGNSFITANEWIRVYLHINDDGLFGLYVSKNDPHDMMLPKHRINSFHCIGTFL
jgi:hypothetical protein